MAPIVVDEAKRQKWHESDFDPTQLNPTHSALLLMWHIWQKGYQAGGVIGVPASLAIAYFKKEKLVDLSKLLPRVGNAAMLGFAATSVMGMMKMKTFEGRDEVDDRVYRLHYHEGQNRTDQFSQLGALGGVAFAAAVGARSPLGLLGGCSVGSTVGILAHVATSQQNKK